MEDEREKLAKLIQLRNVLERDRFEGLNRKVNSIVSLNIIFDRSNFVLSIMRSIPTTRAKR
jgi:hypothetical protein